MVGIDNEEEEQRKVTKKHYKGVDCSVSKSNDGDEFKPSNSIPFQEGGREIMGKI